MLMLSWKPNCCDVIKYQSELGLLQIRYTAYYCEPGRKYETGGFSSNGFSDYAMIREVVLIIRFDIDGYNSLMDRY